MAHATHQERLDSVTSYGSASSVGSITSGMGDVGGVIGARMNLAMRTLAGIGGVSPYNAAKYDSESTSSSMSPMNVSSLSLTKKKHAIKKTGVNRRISCKDLGGGDCRGWLWKKKEGAGLRPGRWVKCWFVLHHKNLFYFNDPEDLKAQGVIHLPGFTVSPTQESRSKKFAFKVYNQVATFYFASERQDDMAKWMNKMGLASLGDFDLSAMHIKTTAGFSRPSRAVEPMPYFSESDEDSLSSPSWKGSPAHSTAGSREDLTDMYRHLCQADLTIAGVNVKVKRSSMLAGASFLVKPSVGAGGAERELYCKLLCHKRTLKDKEDQLLAINKLLQNQPITAEQLEQFKLSHASLFDDMIGRSDEELGGSSTNSNCKTAAWRFG
jgi:connector enhancer of kinase suppressor of Ras 2